MPDLISQALLLVVGIAVLMRASVYIVNSLSSIAKFLQLSEFTISFIIMAFATSLPELAVGINAAAVGSSELSLGNILGTNVVNISLIGGFIALIAGRVAMSDYGHFRKERLFNFILVISPVIFLVDGLLTRLEGIILLLLFGWSLTRLLNIRERVKEYRESRGNGNYRKIRDIFAGVGQFFRDFSVFIFGVGVLMAASYAIVSSSKNISLEFGLPEILIGIFVVGLGTSLPELAFGIKTARLGKGDMSLGNLLGSSVINSTLILGVTAVISPIVVSDKYAFWMSVLFMAASMFFLYYFLRTKNYLVRKEGLMLIFFYIVFIFFQTGISFF